MTLKEFYEQIDGSYEDTLHRLTSEALVHRFVLKYPADPSFAQLREAVAAADWESAFSAAHTLKGVAQNRLRRTLPRVFRSDRASARWTAADRTAAPRRDRRRA